MAQKNLALNTSKSERKKMVEFGHPELSLSTQAELLLSLSRSGLYYQPVGPSAREIEIKHCIDEIYTRLEQPDLVGMIHKKAQNTSIKKKPGRTSASTEDTDKYFKSEQKEAITKTLRGIFPGINERSCKALFDLALVSNVKENDVLWAAALYVSRGGKVNQAI